MSDIAIKVQNLGKKYQIRHGAPAKFTTIREAMTRTFSSLLNPSKMASPSMEDFWALKDVSFDIKKGECVGIIGRNGAGKSTLLKILSRITEPTTGRIELYGRVASLLEVGTGFHQELSGRENIYLNGTILGMTKKEITRKFDEIVAFAEIDRFLDTPVKRYSSGMYVRLAFAVAAHLEPEILVVDEVLAVGDAEFQKKCLGKMKAVGQEGRTVLFVSHNMGAIRTLCTRGILINNGVKIIDGNTDIVLDKYNELSRNIKVGESTGISNDKLRRGEGAIRFTDIELQDIKGEPCISYKLGENIRFRLSYKIFKELEGVKLSIALKSGISREIVTEFEHILSDKKLLPGSCGEVTIELPENEIIRPGEYPLYFHLSDIKSSSSSIDVVDELTPPLVILHDSDIKRSSGFFKIPSRVIMSEIKSAFK